MTVSKEIDIAQHKALPDKGRRIRQHISKREGLLRLSVDGRNGRLDSGGRGLDGRIHSIQDCGGRHRRVKDDLHPPVQASLLLITIVIQWTPLAIGSHLLAKEGRYIFELKTYADSRNSQLRKPIVITVAADIVAMPVQIDSDERMPGAIAGKALSIADFPPAERGD